MPNITFYLLEEQEVPASQTDGSADPLLLSACDLAAKNFRARKRVWVNCNDQTQAEAFDELLWRRPVDAFVPHGLVGEGAGGAPVEIGWEMPSQFGHQVLINLADEFPEFARRYSLAYDFVPADETRKQLARVRYKHFRMAGFELATLPVSKINEIDNG